MGKPAPSTEIPVVKSWPGLPPVWFLTRISGFLQAVPFSIKVLAFVGIRGVNCSVAMLHATKSMLKSSKQNPKSVFSKFFNLVHICVVFCLFVCLVVCFLFLFFQLNASF